MMHRSSALKTHVIVGVLMLTLGFGGGWVTAKLLPLGGELTALLGPGIGANAATPADLRDQFSVFWEVWNLVEGKFYQEQPLDRQRMIQGAIRGMLGALEDPYTVYQEPDLAALTNEHMQGSFEGIGAYIRVADGKAFIDRPIKNSPATKAGLQQDDQIVAIDGQQIDTLIAGLDPNEATVEVATALRGPKGSTVDLLLRRADGPPFAVTIVRDEVIVSSVSGQMLGSVAYIKISDFKSTTTDDFDAAMRELLLNKPSAIVLDLRNNPGGYLTNAQQVLGRFYDGVALVEEHYTGEQIELRTLGGASEASAFDLPLVVLVNGNSASASEIVAGALRDRRPATYLIGEKTYGKGSVQNIYSLSDGGSARITTAHWLTPDKAKINAVGITPEYVVPYSEDAASAVPCVADRRPAEGQSACADSQLAWAVRLLTTGQTPPAITASQQKTP